MIVRLVIVAAGLSCLVFVTGCVNSGREATETAPQQRGDRVPMGRLGRPIGSYLTIEGVRMGAEQGKVGTKTLLVDTVNGSELEQPIGIWIENVEALPASTRCVFKGYESARWIGIPQEVIEATGCEPQAGWQLWRYFVVTSTVRP